MFYFWFMVILGVLSLLVGLSSVCAARNGFWVGYLCGVPLILLAFLCFFLAYQAYTRKTVNKRQLMVPTSQTSALCNKGALF